MSYAVDEAERDGDDTKRCLYLPLGWLVTWAWRLIFGNRS